MRCWYFSEQSYYPAWGQIPGNPKIVPPANLAQPEVAHRLLQQYLRECQLADELGMDIMVNEHHGTYTCMAVSCMLTLSALAACTRKARLLALGIPIVNRMDPFRIAEEIAYVDNLCGGRLEVGLIKGTPFEMYISNQNPASSAARYWEVWDLVLAALTHQDGPFSWESENFNYRYVNVIPRCYQQPHPPMWLTTASTRTAPEAAKRDCVLAITALARVARESFPIYRKTYLEIHKRPAPLDRFAYLANVAVAADEATARQRANKLLKFAETSERIEQRYLNPPGALMPADNVRFLRARSTVNHRERTRPDGTPMSNPPTAEDQRANDVLFWGTPDQVFDQIRSFYDSVGGFGNLLVQMGGTMTHGELRDGITLFAKRVMPRLRELTGGKVAA
ncbi:MAG TPA: LLM class flavin-dependent oxidoreductase [Burkholderiales bacterium]|nr:LLM class flavin-dependent oxidoreductase [Burkholderiales bacterium]